MLEHARVVLDCLCPVFTLTKPEVAPGIAVHQVRGHTFSDLSSVLHALHHVHSPVQRLQRFLAAQDPYLSV